MKKKAFIHHPVRWNLYHRYSNVTKTATDIPDFRNTEISVVSGMDREAYPLILNTGSRKPQLFHARTYRVPWLAGLEKATLVEIHPEDAKKYGIADGDMVRVSSRWEVSAELRRFT